MKVLSLIMTAALLVLAKQLAADLKRQGLLPVPPRAVGANPQPFPSNP